ncbi:alkaline phosphatase family protein [Candidatus Micrarchaeota archaeon]|nr:alkaline phosphatase family protein [Candidatus Micrarchaeota archaeon]
MIVIVGIDGLEYDYVKEFNLPNLMQRNHGTTDLSEFEEPRTMVIWSSFMAGKNLEKEILSRKNLWEFRLKPEETFFSKFNKHIAIDVPGYTQDMEQHNKERQAMKDYFVDKKISVEEYDELVLRHHEKIKDRFFESLEKDYDIVMGYFGAADVIGHLSFGIKSKMKIIYKEMDEIVRKTSEKADKMIVISDHGMKAVGRFGDHSDHGFWSVNFDIKLEKPKPTEFYKILADLQ